MIWISVKFSIEEFHAYHDLVITNGSLFVKWRMNHWMCEELKWGRKPQKGWERAFGCFKATEIDGICEMTYCMLNHIVVFRLMTWPLLFLQKHVLTRYCMHNYFFEEQHVHNHPMTWHQNQILFINHCFRFEFESFLVFSCC